MRVRPPPEGRISTSSPLRSLSGDDDAGVRVVDVDDDLLDRLQPLARCPGSSL